MAYGCDPLVAASPAKERSARRHSREMAEAGKLFHSDLRIGHWSKVGEVIGTAPTLAGIVTALFDSPDHRDLLLNCDFDKIAVGPYFGGATWFTGRLYAR